MSRPISLVTATVVPTAEELAQCHADPVHQELIKRHRAVAAIESPARVSAPRGGATASIADTHSALSLNALATTATIDAEQSQLRMIAGGSGIIYSVQADGRLLCYRHLGWVTGDPTWANGGFGRMLDDGGWQDFETVLAAEDGQLFGIGADGTVRWYRYLHDLASNTGTWAPGGGTVIGTGFNAYAQVFGGWRGVIYAVDGSGDLYWFRYLAGNGSTGPTAWANGGHGALIKSDVRLWLQFVADQDGVLYGVRQGAILDWMCYLGVSGQGGPGAWANGGDPVEVGTGWTQEYQRDVTAMGGTVYSVFVNRDHPSGPDHELYWFRLLNWQNIPANGTPNWSSSVGRLVGTGWTTCRTASLQAHSQRPSVSSGQSVGVAVSSTLGSCTASLLRITGPLPDGGTVVWGPQPLQPPLQSVQSGYRRSGTGWATNLTVPVAANLPSGFYVVELAGPFGMRRHAPLVVRPAAPGTPVALMLPFLSHNAYNTWGGHSQYTWDEYPGRKYAPLARPSANLVLRESGRLDARWLSDLFLMRWLATAGIGYDCYQDLDLHQDGTWLGQYRVLVLGSHPEYWTPTMRTRLITYLAGGGRVIYTGGNGLYEPVEMIDADTVAMHRDANGNRVPYRNHGLPELDVFGVAFGGEYMTFQPYQVVSDHPFLAGTGLGVGDLFGDGGYNIAASGWEMDQISGTDPDVTLIARGLQKGGGADMVVCDKPNGGWVFAASSLSFNGSLQADPAMSQILRNVFDAAVN